MQHQPTTMRCSVIALDYDGTIAAGDQLDPDVRASIDLVRARGIVVIIVTGRILSELRRVAGDLRFVDAVVAENGAVLHFPQSGRTTLLSHSPAPDFVQALRRNQIDVSIGMCVVEAEAGLAPLILDLIRDLELPLTLLFNHGRMMVLPQGVSKASGLGEALRSLRLSPHNALAIGDAENDHAMLELCEVGVAVAWGSPALKAVADVVLPGTGPAAVASYLREVADCPCLPPLPTARHRLLLGHDDAGQPLELGVRGRNVLIAGDPRSGKSWVAGLLCEQLILQRYSVCVIDPEGDYRSLEALPGVLVWGDNEALLRPHDLIRELRYPDLSVVIDLSKLRQSVKEAFVTQLLPMLAGLRRRMGLPHRIVIDEAHYFLHDPHNLQRLHLEQGGYTLVTYRVAPLPSPVLAASDVIIVTRRSIQQEVQALHEKMRGCGDPASWEVILGTLPIDQAVLLPGIAETGSAFRRFHVAPRLTRHVRHKQKYVDVPVGEWKAFVFTENGIPIGARAATLQEFAASVEQISEAALDGHLQRNDVSRWIADVFGDVTLAAQVRNLEHQYQLHPGPDIRHRLVRLICDRYVLADEAVTASDPLM